MKKILSLIFLSLILVSCGKDEDPVYFWKPIPEEWTVPEMKGATSFEILQREECQIESKYSIAENKVVDIISPCDANIHGDRLYRIKVGDEYKYYTLGYKREYGPDDSMEVIEYWKISDNTF